MSEDMSNLMNKINSMMQSGEIPDDVKNMMSSFLNQSKNTEKTEDNQDVSSHTSSDTPELDMATIMKIKSIMDSMKTNKNDPRANLLRSLKPYLKDSRKEKVDKYIQLLNMEKVFEMLTPLGGESNK